MKFKFEGTSADKRLIAFGGNHEELFQNAALGMFSEIVAMKKVPENECKEIEIRKTGNLEEMLVDWLNELLYYFDSECFVGTRYDLEFLKTGFLKAKVYGTYVTADFITGEIKAATFHEVAITKKKNYFEARVILDV